MNCPSCPSAVLHQHAARPGTLVDTCLACHGLWLDAGELLEFCEKPHELDSAVNARLKGETDAGRNCPRSAVGLRHGRLAALGVAVDRCPDCAGLWLTTPVIRQIDADRGWNLNQATQAAVPLTRASANSEPRRRLQQLAQGLRHLPNLALRSAMTLLLLYGMVALVLITLVELDCLSPMLAFQVAGASAVASFLLGPWLTDLSLGWFFKVHWQQPTELPKHLRSFIERVCAEQRMQFPHLGLIDDGTPTAFTYGHIPDNARVVVSRGLLELLTLDEAAGTPFCGSSWVVGRSCGEGTYASDRQLPSPCPSDQIAVSLPPLHHLFSRRARH